MTLLRSLLIVALFAAGTGAAQTAATARVAGRVVDAATGEPIAGARVSLGWADAQRPALPPRPLIASTNADGVFLIGDVPAGRWRLIAEKTGFYLAGGGARAPIVVVAAARVAAPDIRLDRGGTISGRLTDAGNPASDLTVAAVQSTRGPNGTFGRPIGRGSAETNDLGEFRLAGLPPGEYYVIAQRRPAPGIQRNEAPSRTILVSTYYPGVTDLAIAAPVTVTRGGTTQYVDFQMLVEASYQVSGVAVDTNGQPAAGAIVQLFPIAGISNGWSPRGTAESDGTFRIVNVPSGTYRVVAAIPVRNGSSTSVTLKPIPGVSPPEVTVSGAHVAGVHVIARRP